MNNKWQFTFFLLLLVSVVCTDLGVLTETECQSCALSHPANLVRWDVDVDEGTCVGVYNNNNNNNNNWLF